jgi:hypothetical protein
MALLDGRAGHLTAENGGFRRGQYEVCVRDDATGAVSEPLLMRSYTRAVRPLHRAHSPLYSESLY